MKVFEGDFSGAMDTAAKAGSTFVDSLTGVKNTIDKVTGAVKETYSATLDQDVTGAITVDGSTINLNNGTNGAARINDDVDSGDDPAGISGSDGSNIIESGSGTVFIGG